MGVASKTPSVFVILVTYNNENDIEECLQSVSNQDYRDFRIIVVDNNSSDSTVDLVKGNFPTVKLIRNERNLGFAAASNMGIQECCCDYVAILNPDTVAERGWLSELVNVMERNRNAGAAMSKILLYDRRDILNSGGNEFNFLGFAWAGNYGRKDEGIDGITEVPYPSGGSMILRKSVLDAVGLFDERFFLYQEDADLGIRIHIAGYDVLYCPTSVVYHKYTPGLRKEKLYYLERNRIWLLLKDFETKTLLLILPALSLMEAGIILHSIAHRWLLQKLKAYVDAFRGLDHCLSKRAEIQTMRKIKDRELFELFRGGIYHDDVNSPLVTHVLNPFLERYFRMLKRVM